MTGTVATWGTARRRAIAVPQPRARRLDGERLALGATAAAVALLPLLSPGGPANIAPVDLLIGLALAACLLWAGTSGRRLRFPYVVPAAVMIAGGALGALVGPVPGSGIVALVQDGALLMWCWAVVNIGSSPERLRILLATWAYSAVAWVVALFLGIATGLSALTGQTASEGSRTALTFLDPNYSASYYFISIMIIWATGRPRHRGVRVAAYLMLVVALASTGSNSGIVSLIVGTAVAGLVAVYRRRGMVPAITALAFVLLGGYMVASHVSMRQIQERAHGSRYGFIRDGVGRSELSFSQRDMLLHESVQLYRSGGPLGEGPVSTKPRLHAGMAPFVKEAHDDYLASLIERGAVGFFGFLLLLAGLGLRIFPLARSQLAAGFAAVVVRPNALVGAVAGTAVAGAVYELLHVRHVWTLFAFVAALYVWGRR
jgi:O-Antigen ligase